MYKFMLFGYFLLSLRAVFLLEVYIPFFIVDYQDSYKSVYLYLQKIEFLKYRLNNTLIRFSLFIFWLNKSQSIYISIEYNINTIIKNQKETEKTRSEQYNFFIFSESIALLSKSHRYIILIIAKKQT